MVSETVVSVVLEASITGAGVILAIYALITPISDKIFKERARKLEGLIEKFDKEKEKITAEAPDKDFEHLKDLRDEIKRIIVFPKYLGYGIVVTFTLFMLSAFFSIDWLWNTSARTSDVEFSIFLTFVFAWSSLFVVGITTVFEIFFIMRKDFEEIKKKQKQVKSGSKYVITA